MNRYILSKAILDHTFAYFRKCGRGRQECQVLWTSPWAAPERITDCAHPAHAAHLGGFVVNDRWLNAFWLELAEKNHGIRVQVHTHPQEAFHSEIDDRYPVIHKPGFLSLVIPNFAIGPVGFAGAYLTEIQPDGSWQQVAMQSRLVIE